MHRAGIARRYCACIGNARARARARFASNRNNEAQRERTGTERSPMLISGAARDAYRIIAGYYRAIDGALQGPGARYDSARDSGPA